MIIILLFAWLFVYSLPLQADEHIIASIADRQITKNELLDFAKSSSQLRTYLQMPSGPEKLLDMFIDYQLLLREGQVRNIQRPERAPDNDLLYARIIQQKLVPPCEISKDVDLKEFYSNQLELFSTPLYLRLRRISLLASSEDAINEAQEKLLDIKQQLESGLIEFSQAVSQYSQDELSKNRAGDLGYIPVIDNKNPVFEQFLSAKKDSLIGPITEKTGLVNLYQVTDRREPIIDSYEAVKSILPEEFLKHCNKKKYENLMSELKKKWPVQVLINDVTSAIQTQ